MRWSRNKTPGERDQLAVSVTCGHFGDLGEWKRGYDRRNLPQDLNSVSCEDQGWEVWLSPEQEINALLKGWEKYMFGSQKQTKTKKFTMKNKVVKENRQTYGNWKCNEILEKKKISWSFWKATLLCKLRKNI